jgi:butyryl-CoA dehydrogenase
MIFDLTSEQEMVQHMARDFAEKHLRSVAEEIDQTKAFPFENLKKMAQLGLMGMNISIDYNGSEVGVVTYSLAITEIGKACAATGVTTSVTNMVAEVIQEFATEEIKKTHLPRICDGTYPAGSFALTEPSAGSDAASILTTAEKDGDGYRINGTKTMITSGEHSGITVVWAVTDKTARKGKGISAFVVEKGREGFHVGKNEEKLGQRASSTNELIFEDCQVPKENLLGKEGDGFKIAMMELDGGRIGIGSLALGIGLAAIEYATAYVKDREQFGKSLSNFQAIQWMIADSYTELEAARLLLLRAAYLKENGRKFSKEASMAKVFASETARQVAIRSIQMLGGYGYTKDYPVERFLRDVIVTTLYEGTSEVQRMVIAREILRGG